MSGATPSSPVTGVASASDNERTGLMRRHTVFGWWSLLVFAAMGLFLESMHGFKIGWYLDVDVEPRRHMLRLAHAHGTLLGLVHLAFAEGLRRSTTPIGSSLRLASACLIAGSICMPGGFVLGGLFLQGGDPGPGVLLVPLGGVLLLAALFMATRAFGSRRALVTQKLPE